MDVGQIIGATSTANRQDPALRDEDNNDFSNYLEDQAAPQEPPVKEPVKAPVKAADAPEQTSPSSTADATTEGDRPVSEKTTVTTEPARTDDKPALPVIASEGPAKPSPVATAAASAKSPVSTAPVAPLPANPAVSPTDAALNSTPVPRHVAGQMPESARAGNNQQAAIASQKSPVITPVKAKAAAQAAAHGAAPVTAPTATSPKKAEPLSGSKKVTSAATVENSATVNSTPTGALEKIRTEAANKMSEKDMLSAKVAELLQDGKGKISVVSSANSSAKSFQSTLASSTNLVTAATADATVTAFGMTGQASAITLDNPLGQTLPGTTQGQAIPGETTQSLAPAPPAAAIQGVDATAINSASQASNAARIAGQTPAAEQVSLQISNAVKEGADRIKISLHPSELGRVDVKLEIGQDGRIIAAIAVDKQETLDLLQRDSRSLEKALQDAGFETGSGSLNFSLSKDGQDEPMGFAGGDPSLTQLMENDDQLSAVAVQMATGSTGDGNLDIQV